MAVPVTLSPTDPLGYDPFALDYIEFEPSLPLLEEFGEMTEDPIGSHVLSYDQEMLGIQYTSLDSAHAQPASSSSLRVSVSGTGSASASDAARSPGGRSRARASHQMSDQSTARQATGGVESTAGGSSLSPAEKMILTPTSTNFEYNASISDQQDEEDPNDLSSGLSPSSTTHTTDGDFVLVAHSHSGGSTTVRMTNQPPQSSAGSGASRSSSVAPPALSNATSFSGQWGSFTSTTNGWMDHHGGGYAHADPFNQLGGSYVFDDSTIATSAQFDRDLMSSMGSFDGGDLTGFNAQLPIRATGHHVNAHNNFQMPSAFAPSFSYGGQHHPLGEYHMQRQRQHSQNYPAQQYETQDTPRIMFDDTMTDTPTTSAPMQQLPSLSATPPFIKQEYVAPLPSHSSSKPIGNPHSRPSSYTPSQSRPSHRRLSANAAQQQVRRQNATAAASAGQSNRSLPAIAKADPGIVPSQGVRQGPNDKGRRGGRQKHTHLPEHARLKSHKMRKLAACWRCALQRDPCDEGTPCQRCMIKAQKGQTYYFDCDRSKLPDFVHDFLPLQASMTLMHQKQTIEDCVTDQVMEWDHQNPIDVYLTSGYGPALRWKLYEFRPRTNELLGQFQYLQDPQTGISRRYQKYSPPFGLLKLDSSDDAHFEEYLDQLMHHDYLWDFGWTCFEEECQVDPEFFQAKLLELMCTLYEDTTDDDLKEVLKGIIRMMIITYIMGHTLTIIEDTLPSVLASVKFSQRPPQTFRHTSPRLANRQLKFFFAILRNNIYEKILKWQQQVLHTSGKKEESWLPSFCAMLGFAMVLEEVQRTIQIQADAKAAKGELSPDQANTEAYNACERIDARFRLLVGLFQCKYRDKKWGANGSFGPETPEFKDQTSRNFLRQLRTLLEQKAAHLESRRHVECAPENQCLYTSRLVARFLLPFLKLPSS